MSIAEELEKKLSDKLSGLIDEAAAKAVSATMETYRRRPNAFLFGFLCATVIYAGLFVFYAYGYLNDLPTDSQLKTTSQDIDVLAKTAKDLTDQLKSTDIGSLIRNNQELSDKNIKLEAIIVQTKAELENVTSSFSEKIITATENSLIYFPRMPDAHFKAYMGTLGPNGVGACNLIAEGKSKFKLGAESGSGITLYYDTSKKVGDTFDVFDVDNGFIYHMTVIDYSKSTCVYRMTRTSFYSDKPLSP